MQQDSLPSLLLELTQGDQERWLSISPIRAYTGDRKRGLSNSYITACTRRSRKKWLSVSTNPPLQLKLTQVTERGVVQLFCYSLHKETKRGGAVRAGVMSTSPIRAYTGDQERGLSTSSITAYPRD
jgi:hypothetical protein